MTDIIEKLYTELLSEGSIRETSYATYQDLYEKDEQLWSKVQPVLGPDIINELQNSQNLIQLRSNLEWFRRGVRTGMSLMLELL